MKICPNCQTRYTDDTLQFCLQDGTHLVGDAAQASAPTVAFNTSSNSGGEEETVVKNRPAEQIQFDLQNSRATQNWQNASSSPNYETAPRKSHTALIVTTTVLGTILLLGIVGAGAWIYFSRKNNVAQNANVKSSFPVNSSNTNSAANPSPTATAKPTEEKSPTPKPSVNPGQIKEEVSDTIDGWRDQAESRNLSAYMNNYADSVDYYNKKGLNVSAVRADKQRAFTTFDTIEMEFSNVKVTPADSGDAATAVFDKEWYFENSQKTSEGKVQTQLQLRKIGGVWKIVSEKDLKVYYVN